MQLLFFFSFFFFVNHICTALLVAILWSDVSNKVENEGINNDTAPGSGLISLAATVYTQAFKHMILHQHKDTNSLK